MTRKILHLDLDAFYCTVEEQFDASLKGKPFAVGGRVEERGVVMSCSYPARALGIRSAMPMFSAVKLCSTLIIIPPHFDRYREASRQVMAILHELTPLVEQLSIDEAFMDVSELPEPSPELAQQLQNRINNELHLSCSLGVASNKLIAKIANTVGKGNKQGGIPPNAISIVPPGEEAVFLAPLPTRRLWGVGPKTAEYLAEMGINTIGDIARYDEKALMQRFGKNGAEMARHAKGIDDRPVETELETKSVSRETTFVNDVRDPNLLKRTLLELSQDTGEVLRKEALKGRTIKLKLRRTDFTITTRQLTLPEATDSGDKIYEIAVLLLEKHWSPQIPVRLIGVGVSGFGDESPNLVQQLSLWG